MERMTLTLNGIVFDPFKYLSFNSRTPKRKKEEARIECIGDPQKLLVYWQNMKQNICANNISQSKETKENR